VQEIVDGFDISKFGSAPTKFDANDLDPLTARYLATLTVADVAGTLSDIPEDTREAFWNAIKGNIASLDDVADWWAYFVNGAEVALIEGEDREFVIQAFDLLGDPPYADDTWSTWTAAVKDATGRKGKGLFMPLRKAVTGRIRGPEMAEVMSLLQIKPKV
jgi:glutamyl-tRNA synthetase